MLGIRCFFISEVVSYTRVLCMHVKRIFVGIVFCIRNTSHVSDSAEERKYWTFKKNIVWNF